MVVVAIGGSAVVIYVVLGPTAVERGSSTSQVAFSIAHPVGDMVLLVGLAALLLSSGRWPPADSRFVYAKIAARFA
jgi:hypothetical protein